MYQYIFQILLWLFSPQYFKNIEQKNLYKTQFNQAYKSREYKKAIEIFETISKTSKIIEPELRIQAAQAYFITNDTLNAKKNYLELENGSDLKQNALINNQLGLLAVLRGDSSSGLKLFQKAIVNQPNLHQARYNYELIYKLYKPRKTPSPPPISTENKKTQDQKTIASDEKIDKLDTYKSEKISKEKALQLLNDLKNSEKIIYSSKKNTSEKSKKDW